MILFTGLLIGVIFSTEAGAINFANGVSFALTFIAGNVFLYAYICEYMYMCIFCFVNRLIFTDGLIDILFNGLIIFQIILDYDNQYFTKLYKKQYIWYCFISNLNYTKLIQTIDSQAIFKHSS